MLGISLSDWVPNIQKGKKWWILELDTDVEMGGTCFLKTRCKMDFKSDVVKTYNGPEAQSGAKEDGARHARNYTARSSKKQRYLQVYKII